MRMGSPCPFVAMEVLQSLVFIFFFFGGMANGTTTSTEASTEASTVTSTVASTEGLMESYVNISGEFSTNPLGLASTISVTANVTFPPGASTELKVEFFEMLGYSVVFVNGPIDLDTGTLKLEGTPQLNKTRSSIIPEIYDSISYDMGNITNEDQTQEQVLTLVFEAVVAKKSYMKQIKMALGIKYTAPGVIIWSIQKSYTYDTTSLPTPTYGVGINCIPTELEIDFFCKCEVKISTTDKHLSNRFSVTAFVGNADDLGPYAVSINNMLELNREDKHFTIPEDHVREFHNNYIGGGFSNYSTIELGHVVKPEGYGAITFKVIVSSKWDSSFAGSSVDLSVNITSNYQFVRTYTKSINFIAETRPRKPLPLHRLDIQVSENTTAISNGDLFIYEISVNTTATQGKFEMHLDTSPTNTGMTVCDMTVVDQEYNIPFVYQPYASDGFIYGGNIHNTRQVLDPNSGVVKYMVIGQFDGAQGSTGKINFALKDGTSVPGLGSITITDDNIDANSFFKSATISRTWSTLEPNRAVAIKLVLETEPNTKYPEMVLVFTPVDDTLKLPLKICGSYMGDIPRTLSCVQRRQQSIENSAQYSRLNNDTSDPLVNELMNTLRLNIGTISTSNSAGTLEYSFVISMPWGDPGTSHPALPANYIQIKFRTAFELSGSLLWSKTASIDMSRSPYIRGTNQLGSYRFAPPELSLYPDSSSYVSEGYPYLLIARIQTGAGMTHDLDFWVYPPSGTELCRISLKEVGKHLSCIEGGNWYNGERFVWRNTSRIYYNVNETSNARLSIFGLTNVGEQDINITYNNHNAILINIPLFILPGFGGGEIKVVMQKYSSSGLDTLYQEVNHTISSPSSPPTSSFPTPPSIQFTAKPNAYIADTPNILEVEGQFMQGAASDIVFKVTAPADAPLCCAHVIFVGELMPCLNGSLATDTISSDGTNMEVNLGKVCRIEQTVVDFPDADRIRVRVGFNPAASVSSPLTFSADLKLDGTSLGINAQTTVAPGGSMTVGSESVTIVAGNFSVNETRINTTVTAYLTLSVPIGATIPVKIKLSAFPSVARTSLTISNVQFISVGKNMICSEASIQEIIDTTPTSDYYSSHGDPNEMDTVEIDFGYLSNTGLTALTFNDAAEDNYFNISVDAVVNDAPWNDNHAYVGVRLEATSGIHNNVTSGEATIQVIRTADELPALNTTLTVAEPDKIHSQSDEVKVVLAVSHLPESKAEVSAVELSMNLPYGNYLKYNRTEAIGVQPSPAKFSPGNYVMKMKVGPFGFTDTTEVSMYFNVNPDNNHHFGYGNEYPLTIPYSLTTKLYQRFNIDGYDLFPDNSTGRLPTEFNYIKVIIDSPTCEDDVFLDNSTLMPDCLFTASSMIDTGRPPHHARMSYGGSGWAARASGSNEFLEIDMANLHSISRLHYKTFSGFLNAKDLVVASSIDRATWDNEVNITLPNDPNLIDVQLSRTLTGRYFRIYILSSYGNGKIGVKIDFRGCRLTYINNPEDVCDTIVLPPTGDSGPNVRHLAVDTSNDIALFCEYSLEILENQCYASVDSSGSAWRSLPLFIGVIYGYEQNLNILYASDYSRKIYYSSIDSGLHWATTTEADKNAASLSPSWVPSKTVKYYDAEFNPIQLSNWEANYYGILKDSNIVMSWNSRDLTQFNHLN